jgi:hypothetical protein
MSVIEKIGCRNFITYNGEQKSVPDWAREMNVEIKTLISRAKKGWSVHEVLYGKKKEIPSRAGTSTILLRVGDTSMTLSQWADKLGVPRDRLYTRYRRGLSAIEIISPESRNSTLDLIEYKGKRLSLAEWAGVLGVKYSVLYARIRRGGNPSEVIENEFENQRRRNNAFK